MLVETLCSLLIQIALARLSGHKPNLQYFCGYLTCTPANSGVGIAICSLPPPDPCVGSVTRPRPPNPGMGNATLPPPPKLSLGSFSWKHIFMTYGGVGVGLLELVQHSTHFAHTICSGAPEEFA